MLRREVGVRQGVGLRLLRHVGGLGAHLAQHVTGHVVHGDSGPRAPGGDQRQEYPGDAETRGTGAGLTHAVVDEVDHAPLSSGALEGLAQDVRRALVGVGDDEALARGDAAASPAQKGESGLGVNDGNARHPPLPLGVTADGSGHGGERDEALPAALRAGGAEPEVGHGAVAERS